jgi:hypothetical protein
MPASRTSSFCDQTTKILRAPDPPQTVSFRLATDPHYLESTFPPCFTTGIVGSDLHEVAEDQAEAQW